MDWYSWLSKSNLEHGLIYEYSLLFSHNELEEEDIIHFNHEFLQSMGISIAKHRLEILKLAKKSNSPQPVARLLTAMKKTTKFLAKYIHSLVRRENSAIVVVPRPSYGGARWKGTMLKRNKRLALLKQGRLMLTEGSVKVARPNSVTHSASPVAYNNREGEKGGDKDGCWGSSTEAIRWDSMFQDLKPT
ncbi:uncharacterized protein LOC103696034 [Phoenix dactylifera]|uniref:Uncharacterized protein LOC103696034 n=1 Tax=Phoenix dactylifera TaxID=42345 RepID=A0A8B7BFT2_PHODC|nr:uncharacterized protein LOC103696034 [Phoenix dactylifera]